LASCTEASSRYHYNNYGHFPSASNTEVGSDISYDDWDGQETDSRFEREIVGQDLDKEYNYHNNNSNCTVQLLSPPTQVSIIHLKRQPEIMFSLLLLNCQIASNFACGRLPNQYFAGSSPSVPVQSRRFPLNPQRKAGIVILTGLLALDILQANVKDAMTQAITKAKHIYPGSDTSTFIFTFDRLGMIAIPSHYFGTWLRTVRIISPNPVKRVKLDRCDALEMAAVPVDNGPSEKEDLWDGLPDILELQSTQRSELTKESGDVVH
jgi:hypothetical protein